MKKSTKKITAVICASVIVASAAGISMFSINAVNSSDSYNDVSVVTNDDLGLTEANQIYDKERGKNNANDLLAYTILRKYKKTDATELIKDKKTDCDLMREICKMIKNDNLPNDEVSVLKNYLDRRVALLNVPNNGSPILDGERELEWEIEDILGYDRWQFSD